MNNRYLQSTILLLGLTTTVTTVHVTMAAPSDALFEWSTIVNNGDYMPTDRCNPETPNEACRKFNSYNQPSVNTNGLVVMRARSRGGQGAGQPVHGIYSRAMTTDGPIIKILDRNTLVPEPNNLNTTFVEPPSFPRIDIRTATIATRGNHQPVWEYTLADGSDTRVGTTGIYSNPFGNLLTGASKLGAVPEFSFFEVPEFPGTPFDVFPGAPAVTNGTTLVFKGNYTVDNTSKTGVYYRHLQDAIAGGERPVILIANNTDTLIPGTSTLFGSTAPPSAAQNHAVFAGFDNEDQPTAGGIYLAPLVPYKHSEQPKLKTLVGIGSRVPGEAENATFNRLGEGVSFDGRFVSFWGAWGSQTRTLRLYCPNEGNKARQAYCKSTASGSIYDSEVKNWYQEKTVPRHQGIFVHDTKIGKTFMIARTADEDGDFSDFVYWNFSGSAPGVGNGEDGEEDGELARWRASSFTAVSSNGANYHVVFKAKTGSTDNNHVYIDPLDGIYLSNGPKKPRILTLVSSDMAGTAIDPEAFDPDTGESLPVTEMGVERDGFRGRWIVVNVKMGTEETGWAGIYLTQVPSF